MKGSFNYAPIGKVTLEGLIALANPDVNPPLNLNEVIVGVPLSNVGEKNTRINLVFKPDGRFTGPVDFFYNRIDLSEIQTKVSETPYVGPLADGEVPTAAGVLTAFSAKYGIDFEQNEVSASIPSVITGTNYSHSVTLTANPNSLVWKGSVVVKVLRRNLMNINAQLLSGAIGNGILYLHDFPQYRVQSGYSEIFCDADVPPFELDTAYRLGLTKIQDVEQKVVDIINAMAPRTIPPTNVTFDKEDFEIVRRNNSPEVLRYRTNLEPKATAHTSFLVRAKESSDYTGELPFVGWELMNISEYLTGAGVPTFYFQSGQQIDILKLLPRIKTAYNIDLSPSEVEQTAAEPKPGLSNGYTLDLVMNKTSLYFCGTQRFTVDVSGDPYRYITNTYLGDFDALQWPSNA